MFIGFIALGSTITAAILTRNASNVPTDATGSVSYRIYGPAGLMSGGTGTLTLLDSSNTNGFYSFSFAPTGGAGYAAGVIYTVHISYVVTGVTYGQTLTFQVS